MVPYIQPFPDHKPDFLTKIYLGLFGFVLVGTIPIVVIILDKSLAQTIGNNHELAKWVLLAGAVWGITLVLLLPLGIMLLGYWSIRYKESAIKTSPGTRIITYRPPAKLTGVSAIVAGCFYIILGLFLLWGEVGVLTSFFCNNQTFCAHWPSFIKFF